MFFCYNTAFQSQLQNPHIHAGGRPAGRLDIIQTKHLGTDAFAAHTLNLICPQRN